MVQCYHCQWQPVNTILLRKLVVVVIHMEHLTIDQWDQLAAIIRHTCVHHRDDASVINIFCLKDTSMSDDVPHRQTSAQADRDT